ncbi:hypothetical protein [Agromyces tardus]|uniref:hypothetical protein n=1 Tax=Agromyces tardus TaxID=2583849 RepID=UPI0036711495
MESAPDLRVHAEVELYVDDPAIDARITLQASYDLAAGRYVIDSVTAARADGGEEVNGAMLRDLRLQEYVRDGLTALGAVELEGSGAFRLEDVVARRADIVAAGPSDPDTLRWVARIYRAAEIVSARPAKAVQDALGLTQPTATVWIRRARDRRLIFPFGFTEWDRPNG